MYIVLSYDHLWSIKSKKAIKMNHLHMDLWDHLTTLVICTPSEKQKSIVQELRSLTIQIHAREGVRLHHVFSWESDGGPEKGPLMLNVSISLYLYLYLYLSSSGCTNLSKRRAWVGPFQGHHHSLKNTWCDAQTLSLACIFTMATFKTSIEIHVRDISYNLPFQ